LDKTDLHTLGGMSKGILVVLYT